MGQGTYLGRYGVQKLRVLARSGNSSFRPSSTVPRFTTPMVLASCTLSQALLSVPVSPVPLNRADRAHSLAPEVAVRIQLRSTPESSVHSGLRSPGRGRRGRYPTRTVGLLHLSWSVPPPPGSTDAASGLHAAVIEIATRANARCAAHPLSPRCTQMLR